VLFRSPARTGEPKHPVTSSRSELLLLRSMWSPALGRCAHIWHRVVVHIRTPAICDVLMLGLLVQFHAVAVIMARTSNDVYRDLNRLIGQAEP